MLHIYDISEVSMSIMLSNLTISSALSIFLLSTQIIEFLYARPFFQHFIQQNILDFIVVTKNNAFKLHRNYFFNTSVLQTYSPLSSTNPSTDSSPINQNNVVLQE